MKSTADNRFPANLGFTPGKLVLIAVLALVLVGTLVYQFIGTDAGPVVYTKRTPHPSQDETANSPTASGSNGAPAIRAVAGKWPQISVSEASRFDPFAFPEELSPTRTQSANARALLQPLHVESAEDTANADSLELSHGKSPPSAGGHHPESRPQERKRRLEEQQAVAAELQRRGVGMIFRTSRGSVARLGDLEVRVGDQLNGLRVVEINSEGIRLVAEPEDHNAKTE